MSFAPTRRTFLKLALAAGAGHMHGLSMARQRTGDRDTHGVSIFLCGDVMTGRGIDQVLRHSVPPTLYEPYITDARGYVHLAERINGPIDKPVDDRYVWGEALEVLDEFAPDARIINLETAVTAHDEPWPYKGIHYRMHPANVGVLQAADIDCCVLANNHVLDWHYPGLDETLQTLDAAAIQHAGAGTNLPGAEAPAVIPVNPKARILVFAFAFESSGVPSAWAAGRHTPGVNLLKDFSNSTIHAIEQRIGHERQVGDIVIASIHWGANWGYGVSRRRQAFAHALIDTRAVDLIHGHSSHHPMGMEVYRDKLILYGCGDFLNDYEGIGAHEAYRGDLCLMYFPVLNTSNGTLLKMRLAAMQIKRLQLNRTSAQDSRWLLNTLNREGRQFGTRLEMRQEGQFELHWHT